MAAPRSTASCAESALIRGARLVPVRTTQSPAAVGELVDIRVIDGVIDAVAPHLADRGEPVTEAAGRWAIPGLWDHHVHMAMWAQLARRVDLGGTAAPEQATARVAARVAELAGGPADQLVLGGGYRSATWSRPPTVAELDAVSGGHPVVLISGDGHNGWVNSAALQMLGVTPREGVLDENEWFALFDKIDRLPGAQDGQAQAMADSVRAAAAKGVVGITDMHLAPGYLEWPERFAAGLDQLRVRPATYPDRFEEVVGAGLRTGSPLPGGGGLLAMGPLKIISDGSLNTRTAYCCEPYADAASLANPRGKSNVPGAELTRLLARAVETGFEVAVHAIGDAAAQGALDAFGETGAGGSIEHAQLVRREDLERMARFGVRASVQPVHLWDDRDVTEQCWPDRADRCFMLASMRSAGVALLLGSDAPVAPLDPWLAMAAAVHRSADARPAYHPEESLSAAEALAASTDGRGTLAAGAPADIVLLDQDPLARVGDESAVASHLSGMPVAATVVAGRVTHSTI